MSGDMLSLLIDSKPHNLHLKYQRISKTASVFIFEDREAFSSNLETHTWNLLDIRVFRHLTVSVLPLDLLFSFNTDWGHRYNLNMDKHGWLIWVLCVPNCPVQHSPQVPWLTESGVAVMSPEQSPDIISISTMYKTLSDLVSVFLPSLQCCAYEE